MTADGLVDLRSDTVTRPTERMRRAMAAAEVDDDAIGHDPTVMRLEERAAGTTGKEAALYAVTGTMCNQMALRALVHQGHEAVAEATAHVISVEKISAATLSGVTYRPVHGNRGVMSPESVAAAMAPAADPLHARVVDLVCVENTHQVGGGTVTPLETLRAIRKVADEHGIPLYMDGARIFNAVAASGVDVADFAAESHALMFCLSKGLGAPIGSVLCGPADLIDEARRVRAQFGGAWRQAGVLAAAGLVALEEGPPRLAEDHENARRLATGVADAFPGSVAPEHVETNIVFVDPTPVGRSAPEIAGLLLDAGVLVSLVAGKVRMLTHRDVSRRDVERAVEAWRRLAAA